MVVKKSIDVSQCGPNGINGIKKASEHEKLSLVSVINDSLRCSSPLNLKIASSDECLGWLEGRYKTQLNDNE